MLHEHDDRRLMESRAEYWSRLCNSTPRSFRCIYLVSIVVSYVCICTVLTLKFGYTFPTPKLSFEHPTQCTAPYITLPPTINYSLNFAQCLLIYLSRNYYP